MKEIAMNCYNESIETIKDAIQVLKENGYQDVGGKEGIYALKQGFNVLKINNERKDYFFKYRYGDFCILFNKKKLLKHIGADHTKKDAEVNDDRFPFSLDISDARKIVDCACSDWKYHLSNKWGQEILFGGKILISEDSYKEMRKACTPEQNEIFDEIFGKDVKKPLYKRGDWVKLKFPKKTIWKISNVVLREHYFVYYFEHNSISTKTYLAESNIERLATKEEIQEDTFPKEGTWCLVSDDKINWYLVKYAGNGRFVRPRRNKEGQEWEHFHVLDQNNLPEIIEE